MLKKSSILLLLFLLLPMVYSITFFVDQPATLWASCKNKTYAESSAEITIYYPNGTLWKINDTMASVAIGRFNYTFIAPNITGNYFQTVDCNISNIHGFDEDDFWVKEAELEMTSMAVVIFIMLITVGVFLLPTWIKIFSGNKYLDSTLRGLCYVFGLFLLSLDATIIVTVADNAKLGINKEIFRYMFLINWAAYLAIVIVVLSFGWKMLQMWNLDSHNRKMGYNEDEQE